MQLEYVACESVSSN